MHETQQPRDPKKTTGIVYAVILVVLLLLNFWAFPAMMKGQVKQVDYGTFLNMLEGGELSTVEIQDQQIYFVDKNDTTYCTNSIAQDLQLVNRLESAGVSFGKVYNQTTWVDTLLGWVISLLPMIILIVWFNRMMRKRVGEMTGGANSMIFGGGKSGAKQYVVEDGKSIKFADVAGEDEAKESLQEIVDFLHNPKRYEDIGAKMPKGVLLVGPPGTGKTLLARAVAGEAGVPFFSIAGSEFVEMFVGMGASKVRDLFKQANEKAPCIIFIDEIDAIGKSRDSRYGGGNDEREQTLNQLLAEMDGFDTSKGLLILAATNRPEVLDQALLRPGRFDRRVIVDKPDLKGRVDVLKVHAKNVRMDETVDLEAIALATSGAVGSDLANMINEAAILAVKKGRNTVSQKDLFEAVEIVLVGKEKKDRVLSKEERKIVSYHEVGHALVSALQKDSEPVQKITIVPRTMGALGYVMNVPEEEKFLNTEKEIRAMLVEFVAGRAAEELVFDTVTTGAANDIEKATKVARAMITQYGMSKKFGLMGLESAANQYLEGRTVLNCSDVTAAEVDQEVMRVLKESYEEAKRLLREHRSTMDQIAAFLIEKETITGKEFMEIFHRVEGITPEQRQQGKNTGRILETPKVIELPQNGGLDVKSDEEQEAGREAQKPGEEKETEVSVQKSGEEKEAEEAALASAESGKAEVSDQEDGE